MNIHLVARIFAIRDRIRISIALPPSRHLTIRYVTIGYITPDAFRQIRQRLGLTQSQLAERLRTTRMTITRYECGMRRIPGVVEAILSQLDSPSQIPMVGVVAAGNPIEPILQAELVEVPPSMLRTGENFALFSELTSNPTFQKSIPEITGSTESVELHESPLKYQFDQI